MDRFWSKVEKTDTCWNWTASTARGYGLFALTKRHLVYAHRYSFEMVNPPIKVGMQIDHLCRNKLCVNPLHLEQVTQAENLKRSRDFWAQQGILSHRRVVTHCKRGHEFTPENTRRWRGQRFCKTCHMERAAAHRAKIKAQLLYASA